MGNNDTENYSSMIKTFIGKNVTEKYSQMVGAFDADFQLALYGTHKLEELNRLIQSKDKRLMADIELLIEFSYNLRYGKIMIVETTDEEHIYEQRDKE